MDGAATHVQCFGAPYVRRRLGDAEAWYSLRGDGKSVSGGYGRHIHEFALTSPENEADGMASLLVENS